MVRHGGRVEQLLGEEAVAVFGLPAAHEDDLLRALRSVVELRDALSAIPLRAAVESGEVLVGAEGRVLSGTALTTARRVKEAARQAEILLGPAATAQSAGAASERNRVSLHLQAGELDQTTRASAGSRGLVSFKIAPHTILARRVNPGCSVRTGRRAHQCGRRYGMASSTARGTWPRTRPRRHRGTGTA